MVDYWKSQKKIRCDFCQCWITDNKPSIEFHENGKRHKENVTKRLAEIGKTSQKEFKKQEKEDDILKQMNEAAMKAYMKDVENNSDYSSMIIKSQALNSAAKEEKEKEEIVWQEVMSDEGHSYYWNTITGESQWEPPAEGYVSLKEQEKQKEEEQKKLMKEKSFQEQKIKDELVMKKEEQRAFLEREKMKSRRLKEEVTAPAEEVQEVQGPVMGPAPRVDPYGEWKTVAVKVQKPIDLELPQQGYVAVKVPDPIEVKVSKFKEKTITQLQADEDDEDITPCTSFKKRKFGGNQKRNIRQKLTD